MKMETKQDNENQHSHTTGNKNPEKLQELQKLWVQDPDVFVCKCVCVHLIWNEISIKKIVSNKASTI